MGIQVKNGGGPMNRRREKMQFQFLLIARTDISSKIVLPNRDRVVLLAIYTSWHLKCMQI